MSKFPANILDEPAAYYAVDDNSLVNIISYIEKGLSFAHFKKLLQSIPFSFKEWASFLHISERSLQRYQKSNKSFDASASEKIVLITMLYNRGAGLFGNKENFNTWLYTNHIALDIVTGKHGDKIGRAHV